MTARAGIGLRDPLGCSIELRHFGLWRSSIAAVALCALAALLGWLFSGSQARPPAAWLFGAAAAALLIAFGWSLARVDAGRLSRQAGSWSFLPLRTPNGEPESGEVRVAIDLGAFMLLSMKRPGRAGTRWLPVQRRGHEPSWHALRCAAHAVPPAAARAAAAPE